MVDGGVVVKVLLVAGLLLAGWGAARLAATVLPEAGMAGQFVAATIAIWNPYVAERLLQGHWSLLVGYGCLPWVAATMLRLRTSDTAGRSEACALVFWIALAGLTPTGLMLAATVAVVCVFAPGSGRPRWRCAAVGLGAAVLVALPWLTAAAVAGSLSSTQAEGVARVRGTRRTRPRHVGQPGQPRWHLECRRRTSLAHNTFRGRRGGGAARRRGARVCRRSCAAPSRCRC